MTLATISRVWLGVSALVSLSARRVWTRRDLTPQERANLLATQTPPTIVVAALGGHLLR
jgi:hypothetical protein